MDPRVARESTLQPTIPGYQRPGKHFQVTVDQTPADNDLATLIGAALSSIFADGHIPHTLYILPENGDIRFRDDGTNPATTAVGTAGVGYPITSKSEYCYTGDLESIKLAGAGASVLVSLYFCD